MISESKGGTDILVCLSCLPACTFLCSLYKEWAGMLMQRREESDRNV